MSQAPTQEPATQSVEPGEGFLGLSTGQEEALMKSLKAGAKKHKETADSPEQIQEGSKKKGKKMKPLKVKEAVLSLPEFGLQEEETQSSRQSNVNDNTRESNLQTEEKEPDQAESEQKGEDHAPEPGLKASSPVVRTDIDVATIMETQQSVPTKKRELSAVASRHTTPKTSTPQRLSPRQAIKEDDFSRTMLDLTLKMEAAAEHATEAARHMSDIGNAINTANLALRRMEDKLGYLIEAFDMMVNSSPHKEDKVLEYKIKYLVGKARGSGKPTDITIPSEVLQQQGKIAEDVAFVADIESRRRKMEERANKDEVSDEGDSDISTEEHDSSARGERPQIPDNDWLDSYL